MAIKKLMLVPDPILKRKSKPVPVINESIHKLLDNMADTMYDANGVGLAAPQIGILKRVIIVDTREEDGPGLIEMINPEIMKASGSEIGVEGCLSIPGLNGDVARKTQIVVRGLDRHGDKLEIEAEGFLARVFQHEVDHLDGILFTERAEQVYPIEKQDDENENT